jgi:phosphoribosylpyrophosphate synthetase
MNSFHIVFFILPYICVITLRIMAAPQETLYQVALPPSAVEFNPEMLYGLMRDLRGSDIYVTEVEVPTFADESPLIKVESAENTLLIFWYAGENHRKAYEEIGKIGSAYTISPDVAGPNTNSLTLFLPFMEARQDQRTRKPMPGSSQMSIVKNQGVNTIALAREISLVARANRVATLDLHNFHSAKQLIEESAYRPEGPIEHINFTSLPVFADHLMAQGVIQDPREWVIGGTDLGDLNRQLPLQRYFRERYGIDIPLAIIDKKRTASEEGTRSITEQRLLYGEVEDKEVILVDDVIASASTLRFGTKIYKDLKARGVRIYSPQALFVDEFYSNTRGLLADSFVRSITVSDVLPVKKRLGKFRDIPYIGRGQEKKRVEILDTQRMFNDTVRALAYHTSIAELRETLPDYIWNMEDPKTLYQEISGKIYPPEEIGAVYLGGGEFGPLETSGEIYSSP